MEKKGDKTPIGRIISLSHSFLLLFVAMSFVGSFSAQGQNNDKKQHLIRGTVTDTKNFPMPGVTIRLDSTGYGVVSDNNGQFSISVPQTKGYLIFSFVGYKTQKVRFKADSPLSVRMQEDITNLEEVQVVAYGSQKKREIIGSIASVKGEDIELIPSPTVSNLLAGKVAGLSIINTTGAPGGGGLATNIRGVRTLAVEERYSNPLYVIDGVPAFTYTSDKTGLNTIAEIDPKDIESIEVLKDASAASIYGSRAANGVILITTKRGRLNQKTTLTASYSHTFINSPSLPTLTTGNRERYHRMQALKNYEQAVFDQETNTYRYLGSYDNPYHKAKESGYQYDYFWNAGNGADILMYQDSLNTFYNNSTNLMDYFFTSARTIDANIQASGGTEHTAFNVAGGYYDETGVMRNTGFKRIKFLSNLYFEVNPKLKINARTYLAYTDRSRSSRGDDGNNFITGSEIERIPDAILNYSTLLPGEGTAAFDALTAQYNKTIERNESYRVRASSDISYEFVKGLTLKVSGAVDFSQQMANLFKPAELDEYKETYSFGDISRNLMLLNENLLSYTHSFHDTHNLDVLLGTTLQTELYNSIGGYGKNAPSDRIHYVPWIGNVYDTESDRDLKDYQSTREKSGLVGIFGRVNYNYRKKYLASVTLRWDASSKFGENVRWGTFPSFALGYAISEENFMKPLQPYVNFAKIRASYGKSGKTFRQNYIAEGNLGVGNPFLGNPTIEPDWTDGLMNSKLTWEKTDQYNIGIDLDLFDYRLNAVIDYYYAKTTDLLSNVLLPGNYSGYKRRWENAYGIVNKGIEITLKYDVIRNDALRWNVSFNVARNRNYLASSFNGMDFQTFALIGNFSNNLNILGKPLYGIYAYNDKGYYNNQNEVPYTFINGKKTYLYGGSIRQFYRPGDRIIADNDGNGQVVVSQPLKEDRVYVGSPIPKVTGGIGTNFKYKGLTVDLNFTFLLKRDILNTGKGASVGTIIGVSENDITKPIFADLGNITFWEKPGDNADFPANRAEAGLNNFATNLASNVEHVNYLKLKTASVSYQLPSKWIKGLDILLFVNAENLFTITNYSGADPETVDIVTGIDDFGNYPLARRYTVGVNFKF